MFRFAKYLVEEIGVASSRVQVSIAIRATEQSQVRFAFCKKPRRWMQPRGDWLS